MWPILLWKKKRRSLIERFLSLQIDDEKAGAQIDVQEQVPIQIFREKNLQSFFKKREFLNVIQLDRKIFQIQAGFEISCHPKSGLNLENDCITSKSAHIISGENHKNQKIFENLYFL